MLIIRRLAMLGGTAALAAGVFAGPAWAGGYDDGGPSCDNENNSEVLGGAFAGGGTTGGNLNCNFQDSDNFNDNLSDNKVYIG